MIAIAIALLAVAARFWVAHRTHSLGEDALITLRYAENIAAGRGWVYNPGERVLGTTTPLFTLVLALFAWLKLPAMDCGIGLNILADGVTCFLVYRLFAGPPVGARIAGLFAALLYALSSTPINISISGMETALVTLTGLGAIHALLENRPVRLGLLGGLLFLLRIDGLLLFALLLIGLTVRQRRFPARSIAVFAAVAAPWIAFATIYFGSPVPASVIAKLTVYSHTAVTPGSFTNTVAFNHEAFASQFLLGWPQRLVTALFCIGAATVLRGRFQGVPASPSEQRGDGLAPLRAPLLWLLVYYGTMLTSHVPAFAWYFLPPWPLFIAIAFLGVSALARVVAARARAMHQESLSARILSIWPAALLAFAAVALLHVRSIERDIAVVQKREDALRRPLGLWLGAHMGPNERVLLEPIGYAGYYSGRRVLDMVGLVSPEVLPYYHTPRALSGIVNGLHPEWLCLRKLELDLLHEQDRALPDSEYTLVRCFPSDADPAFTIFHIRKRSAAGAGG